MCVQTAHTASHRDIKLAGGRHTQSVYKQTTNGQGERGRGFGGGGRDYMVQSDSERDSVVLGTSSHVQFGSAEQQPCHTQDEQCGGVPPSSALCEVLT